MRKQLSFFLLLMMLGWHEAEAQSCGWTDTLLIANNSNTALSFNIDDYFNNDLADPMQGLCGVDIHFTHQFVDNLVIRLTSPAGQTITLIGPNTDAQFEFTFLARWRVRFLPCSEDPVPDFPSGDQWNNNQINNFVNGGLYTGSYHPFIGCLEDFNTGPVNGNWTLSVLNNPSNYGGAVTYVRLFFCDSRGVDCCFADAGHFEAPDVLACEGDSSLIIDPMLAYEDLTPSPTQYGYLYLLGREGVYLDTTSSTDFRGFPAGTYELCGLSYRLTELDSIPRPDGLLTIDSIRNNLSGFTPWGCARLSDTCIQITIAAPPDTTRLTTSICEGEAVRVGASTYNATGQYLDQLTGYGGCDSIVLLDLTVFPIPRLDLDVVICEGDTIRVGGMPYFRTGMYTDTLQTAALGCDSIIRLDLTVLPTAFYDTAAVICAGQTFALGSATFTATGQYDIPFITNQGCDSIVRLNLTVLAPEALAAEPDTLNCYNGSVLLQGSAAPDGGAQTFRWLNAGGQLLAAAPDYAATLPGIYQLEVTSTLNGRACRDTIAAAVPDGRFFPTASAPAPAPLTCRDPIATLDGSASTGENLRFLWSTPNGNLLPPADEATARATAAGNYQLIVTNLNSGCRDTALLTLAADTLPPAVEAGPGFTLTCALPADTLDAGPAVPGVAYLWSGPCVQPIAGTTTRVTANCPGWYFLLAEEQRNGCTVVDSALVSRNTAPPVADVAPIAPLTCVRTTTRLDASASQPVGGLSFVWQGPDLSSPGGGAQIDVDQDGAYTLELIRTDNNCRDTLELIVPIDTLPPIADAGGPPDTLTCLRSSLRLGGPATSQGARFVYSWFDANGLIGSADTLAATQAGQYQFVVQDTLNGCTAQDIVLLAANLAQPQVNAGDDQFLACASDIITLAGDDDLFPGPVSLQWSGPCLIGPTNDWLAQADCIGNYTLTVTRLDNGCSRSDVVTVGLLNDATVAVLPDTSRLSCDTGEALLNTAGSSQGVARWFLEDAPIGLPFPSPAVTQTGLYTLIIDNFDGTCSDTARTLVVVDCSVTAIATASDTLACSRPTIILSGAGSSSGPNIEYQWLPPAPGCILSDPAQLQVEVNCGGAYALVVTQTVAGIADTFWLTPVIDTLAPTAIAAPPDTITCDAKVVVLDGSASAQGPNIRYQWSNSFEDILGTGPTVAVEEPDIYLLEVFNDANGCRGVSQTSVRRDDNVPVIAFGSDVFPCQSDTFRLQAFVTPPSPDYEYRWEGPGLPADINTLAALIDTTGAYTFYVRDALTGCADTASVLVREQLCVPCLSLAPADTITCLTADVTLTAEFCLPCEGCTLQWADDNGPIPGATGLALTTAAAGTYTLTATDTLGFQSAVSATVTALTTPPIADAGPDRAISCTQLHPSLGGSLTPVEPYIRYLWTSAGGEPIAGADLLTIVVSRADTFFLRVTDSRSGCAASDTVVVVQDTLPPIAEAGPDVALGCLQNFVALNGQGSSTGAVTYLWSGPSASCLTGAATLNPVADCPGLYLLRVTNNGNGCVAFDSARVLPPPALPPLPALPDTALTCDNEPLTLGMAVPNPGDYRAQWRMIDANGNELPDGAVDGFNAPITMPGRYRFTLADTLSGCRQSVVFDVADNRIPPPAEAGPDLRLSCTQDSVQLQAVPGPYTFTWTQPQGLPISDPAIAAPFVYAPGRYYLTVTNPANGCTARDSLLVALNDDAPVVDAGPDTLINCFNEQIRLQGQAQTAGGQVEWLWTTDGGSIQQDPNSPTPLIAAAGAYYLQATDPANGCAARDTVWVDADFRLPEAMLSQAENLTLNCLVDTLQLDATPSTSATGSPLTFQWIAVSPGRIFPNNTDPLVFTDRPGLYRLIVTDTGNGCQDLLAFSPVVDREPPQIVVAATDTINCLIPRADITAAVEANGAPLAYRWLDANGALVSDTPTLSVSTAGPYTLVATNTRNGCENSAQVQVVVDILAPLAQIAAPGSLGCERSEVTLNGSASSRGALIRYAWTTDDGQLQGPADSLVATALTPGSYLLRVFNLRNGCAAEAEVQVQATANAIAGATLSLFPPDCYGRLTGDAEITGILGGLPPFQYALAGGAFSPDPFFEDLPIGEYTFIVRDAQGCRWDTAAALLPPSELLVDLGPDLLINLGDSARLEAIVNLPAYDTLRWISAGPIPNPGRPVQIVRPQETAYYVVTVVDEKGCSASDTVLVTVVETIDVFIPTAFSPNGDGQNDRFTLYAGPQIEYIESLEIFDRWGNMVFSRRNFAPNDPILGWDGAFEGRPVNSAVFVYHAGLRTIQGKTHTIKGDVTLMR